MLPGEGWCRFRSGGEVFMADTADTADTAETAAGEHGGAGPDGEQRTGLALLGLAICALVASLVQTLVLPLLPEFMQAFHTSVSAVTWIFTSTLLAGAVATPLLSRFGDMYGKKKMILVAMVLLLAGSLVGALSGSLAVMIVGRALQGISSALIPLSIGVIRDTFPRDRVASGIGLVSATLGVGGGLGLLITGIIAQHTSSYRPVFWLSVVIGAIGLVLVATLTRDAGQRIAARPDVLGGVVMAGWLICLLLALSEAPTWGWGSAGVIGLFAAAAAGCALWVVIELRTREPLVRLSLLVGPRSLWANLASLLLGFGLYAGFSLFTNLVQTPRAKIGYGLSASVLDVGLYLLPATVGMLVFGILAGRVQQRIGAAYAVAFGSAIGALGVGWLAVSSSHVWDAVGYAALLGVGFGIAYAALGTLAVQHVPLDSSAIASGINSLVRTGGGSVGAAITASILASNVIRGTDVPTLHGYVVCYTVLAIGCGLAAVAAVYSGLRYGSRAPSR
jgi:MFS family permease